MTILWHKKLENIVNLNRNYVIFNSIQGMKVDLQIALAFMEHHPFPQSLSKRKDAPFSDDSNEPNYNPGNSRHSELFQICRARSWRFFTASAKFRSKQTTCLLKRGQKRSEIPPILDLATFECFVREIEDVFRAYGRLKLFCNQLGF